jgi:hypothetical protein
MTSCSLVGVTIISEECAAFVFTKQATKEQWSLCVLMSEPVECMEPF